MKSCYWILVNQIYAKIGIHWTILTDYNKLFERFG